MARRYEVRVSDEWRFPTFRSAGREFSRSGPVVVDESDPGSEEILSCPFLEASEISAPEPEVEQPELDDAEDGAEVEQPELDDVGDGTEE